LKSRRLEAESLGDPGSRRECFGCVYFGERDTTIPSDDVLHLIEMARQSLGRIDMISLAEGMADFYETTIRRKVNGSLQPGERPLPRWSAAQVLEHLRHHNQDPLVQQVVLLAETQELRTNILDHCFEVSNRTGRVRPNDRAMQRYEKMVRLQMDIQKMDASKQAFYAAGARVNPEVLSQGPLSHTGKRLHSYLRQR
jgi:hypothetical protein